MTGDAQDAQRAAFDARAAEIRAMTDPEEAAKAALAFVDQQGAFRTEAADVRAELVWRLWEDSGRSPTKTARRLQVTKQRVSDILQRAREARD